MLQTSRSEQFHSENECKPEIKIMYNTGVHIFLKSIIWLFFILQCSWSLTADKISRHDTLWSGINFPFTSYKADYMKKVQDKVLFLIRSMHITCLNDEAFLRKLKKKVLFVQHVKLRLCLN